MSTPDPITERLNADLDDIFPLDSWDGTDEDIVRLCGDGTAQILKCTRPKRARCPVCKKGGPHAPDCTNKEWPSS